jgi:hypothetical protein
LLSLYATSAIGTPPSDIWERALSEKAEQLLYTFSTRSLLEQYAERFFLSGNHSCAMITPANSTTARLSHLQDCKQAPWCNWSQKPALTGLNQELSTVIHGSLHNHVFVGRYQCNDLMLEALHVMGVALEKAVVVIGERHVYETSPRISSSSCAAASSPRRSFSRSPPPGSGSLYLGTAEAPAPSGSFQTTFGILAIFLLSHFSFVCVFRSLVRQEGKETDLFKQNR